MKNMPAGLIDRIANFLDVLHKIDFLKNKIWYILQIQPEEKPY